ncbi:uncharacterized protein LOC106661083 [Cimex lectularius]|uniref:Uncharacterized protein n=1 Tax=Cimex lectularius TaxID=79782 RepID=A0A8I6R9D0_CIMLE|nr:uncharacterized protein LOC106661083 [Cimex lectularius]
MNTGKILSSQLVALSILSVYGIPEKGLLKVPRIYNVLLSSNEMLVPSQAYPVISPVLQPISSVYFSQKSYELNAETTEKPQVTSYEMPSHPIVEPVLSQNIKNHKPVNADIPDVPPPPLPFTIKEKPQNMQNV